MPQISVIIPVYQVERELPRCLDSLLMQTFCDWEGILVDDGSTDGGGTVCREYALRDPRFRCVRQENGGLSAARNAGIALASGKYIAFLDGDDTLPCRALERLYDVARETGAQLVCGQHLRCVSVPREPTPSGKPPLVFRGQSVRENLFHPLLSMNAWGKLFEASLFSALCFPVGKRFEDAFTIPPVVFSCASMALVEEVVYFYWQRTGSIMHLRGATYYTDWIDAFAECEKLVRRECPSLLPEAQSRCRQSYLRTLDLVLCWPGFRRSGAYALCRNYVWEHRSEFMRDPFLRQARKLYAIGVCLTPDLLSLLLRLRRRRQEAACRRA